MYCLRKLLSIAIEFPHNGTVPGSGTWDLTNSRVAAAASSTVTFDSRMASSRPARRVHPEHDVVHVRQLLGRRTDDEVRPFGDDVQLVVGHDRGDLDDDVAQRIKPRHLEIHPHQHGAASYPYPAHTPLRCALVLEIQLVRLDPDLPAPSYARPGDAGCDLVARAGRDPRPGRRPGDDRNRDRPRSSPRARGLGPLPSGLAAPPRRHLPQRAWI